MTQQQQPQVKVLDTFLRGLKRLAGLADELKELEEEVAGQEARALEALLAEVRPLLPRLMKPVSLREPWRGSGGEGDTPEGVVLVQSFQQDRGPDGRITHSGDVLMIDREGRLVELAARGSWKEGGANGGVVDATWRVESHERVVTRDLAKRVLRPTLTGLLDALRDAIVRGRADRAELKRRLDLLQEVDQVLRRGTTAPPSE